MHFFLSKGTVIGNGEVTGSNRPPSYYRIELDETNDVIKVTAFQGGIIIPIDSINIEPLKFYSLRKAKVLIRESKFAQTKIPRPTNEALRNAVMWIMGQRMFDIAVRQPEAGRDFSNAALKDSFDFSRPEFIQRTRCWQLSQAVKASPAVCREVLWSCGFDLDLAYSKLKSGTDQAFRCPDK